MYSGCRLMANQSVGHEYAVCDGRGGIIKEKAVYFGSKALGYEIIGNIISCEEPEPGRFKSFKIEGTSALPENDDMIREWSALHRSTLERKRFLSEAKKPHPKNVESLIDQLIGSTAMMNRSQKEVFALYVYKKLIRS